MASKIADIGSGTGLLARLFLDFGCDVTGVEPNPEMRATGVRVLSGEPRFHTVKGRAEATTCQIIQWILLRPPRHSIGLNPRLRGRNSNGFSSPRDGRFSSGTSADLRPDLWPSTKPCRTSSRARSLTPRRPNSMPFMATKLAIGADSEPTAFRRGRSARTDRIVDGHRSPARKAMRR